MDFYHYIAVFTEGILAFISPCMLPMLPLYLIYLGGNSAKSVKGSSLTLRAVIFVLGFTLVFSAFGAAATAIGAFLRENMFLFRKISAIFMIILGIHYSGLIKLPFLIRSLKFEHKSKTNGLLSSAVFGMSFAFGWSPCVGIFLSSALLLAGNSKTVFQGISMLFVFSMGLGIPFILSALFAGYLRDMSDFIKARSNFISLVSGIFLSLAGILMFFGIIFK